MSVNSISSRVKMQNSTSGGRFRSVRGITTDMEEHKMSSRMPPAGRPTRKRITNVYRDNKVRYRYRSNT
jgi:hypothetical protein